MFCNTTCSALPVSTLYIFSTLSLAQFLMAESRSRPRTRAQKRQRSPSLQHEQVRSRSVPTRTCAPIKYNTRSSTLQQTLSPLQVAHAPKEQKSLGAIAQLSFLEGVGIITTQVEDLKDVLTVEESDLFSCALQHTIKDDDFVTSTYFTPSEWDKVVKRRNALLKKFIELHEKDEDEEKRRKVEEWLVEERKCLYCIYLYST